ncbi:ATP-binding protein [Vibrio hepatarius]|jgi:two-component system C4-dicarboxylate transport sensor histidine kinase DctB|uniref:C4-dicarboxylate transport sensor protein DctB n=2 Tax=Vibrio hepatarius TaxID=171383 RepID=A0A0M0I2M3_9VIBR|nr:ATP-binding protein [Vibrio hepatarius]KOO08571.1 ATPase [Vibrio hepatarius]
MSPFRRANLYLLLFYLLCLILGSQSVWNYHYQSLLDEHQAQLDRFASNVSSKLDKYAHLPQLLAKDAELIAALKLPDNPAQINLTNRYLENVNTIIQAADTYLLDRWGNTISASNWNLQRSFVGINFAWRPYFSDAIAGNASQYFALGSTSGQRGYYYSYPVVYAAEIIGVIVVKMDLSAIESNWKSKQNTFVATDENNIVFMSSNPSWLFKSLTPLPAEQRDAIIASRQYLDTEIESLGLVGSLEGVNNELSNPKIGWIQGDYIVSSRQLANLDLTIRVLTEKVTLFWLTVSFAMVMTLVFVIVFLTLQLTYQRQLKKRQFEQLQSEAKQKLEFLVMERTSELHAEVLERTRTEQALRHTQDELIQAAKLAVLGQMSASISHELNNPLAAIRSFADNGRRFLAKEKYDRVDDNLERISNLTDRMATISNQLKSFTRKSDSSDVNVLDLAPIIVSARELVMPQLKASRIELLADVPHPLGKVEVNAIQVEQVLINLMTNAAQAVEDLEQRKVQLSTQNFEDSIEIYIDDNGPGIDATKAEHLFEPFFTTKKNGLGLGLSISQQIIETMKGKLTVGQSPLGGARFTISLPLVSSTANQNTKDS